MNNMLWARCKTAHNKRRDRSSIWNLNLRKRICDHYKLHVFANLSTPRDSAAQFNSVWLRRLVCGRHYMYHFIIINSCLKGGAGVAQRFCNGLPCDNLGFDSQWEQCKNRASRPSQGTVNGGAVSKWVDGTLNINNQPTYLNVKSV